ncbi:ABC transporter permease [Spiroplasma tabanidicola]|uniref:Ribose transport system permease protein n=1 Tax=Spiroplasma tabanidicola TaxID=324079 RepID=A0A6I6CDS6_9MOLU|nr:ABC transporter permease [Spiroplasma tabanidicola]QGS52272.1 ribose transport system permease protein [Spiroplasma tabanidicola]
MKQLVNKNSKEFITNYLDIKTDAELQSVQKYFRKKTEKKYDFVFLLSSYRDSCISNLKNKIKRLEERKQSYLEEAEFKFKNLNITKSEYEVQKATIESGEYKGVKNQIEKLNQKIDKKNNKWNKLIEKKKISNKSKIAKLSVKESTQLEKINIKKDSIVAEINVKQNIIIENDKKELENKNKKIENLAVFKKLEQLDNDLNNKKIGPVEYEQLKQEYSEKVDLHVERYNQLQETQFSKKYGMKIQQKFLLSFSNQKKFCNKSLSAINSIKLIFIIMAFAIIVGIIEPGFFKGDNWKNILYLNADIGCMAIGVTIIILTGGIDLSIGSTMAFATALAARLILGGVNVGITIAAVILFCGISGLISGLFVSILKFPSFIITLVLMMVWRGATQFLLGNTSKAFESQFLTNLIQKDFLGLSLVVWIMFALAIIAFIILRFTIYGRHLYAVGGNYKSAQLSGIKVKTILASAYVFGGLCIGIGSFIYVARIQTASPSAGNAWELDAIACVVLGGTLLTGGKGGIFLTFLGWLSLSILKNALNLIGLSSDIQSILKGLIIMIAVLSNTEYKITRKMQLWFTKVFNNLKTL